MAKLEQIIDEARAPSHGEKRKLREALDRELGPVSQADSDSKEGTFVNRLRRKGLITEVPGEAEASSVGEQLAKE